MTPADRLSAARAVKGCGKSYSRSLFGNAPPPTHYSAMAWASECDDCARLLLAHAAETGIRQAVEQLDDGDNGLGDCWRYPAPLGAVYVPKRALVAALLGGADG